LKLDCQLVDGLKLPEVGLGEEVIVLLQNFERKLVFLTARMGFVLLPLGMCQKSC